MLEEGFHNNNLINASNSSDINVIKAKWSVKTDDFNTDPLNPNNGIWNCDSDYIKETSDQKIFLHQV